MYSRTGAYSHTVYLLWLNRFWMFIILSGFRREKFNDSLDSVNMFLRATGGLNLVPKKRVSEKRKRR